MTTRIASWLCATALVLSAALPPSHIHLADHDHDHGVEHSHWASHGAASRTSIDDDDGLAMFVDHPGVIAGVRASVDRPPADIIAILTVAEPLADAHRAQRTAGNAPRDGPLLESQTLRGPPLAA